MLFLFPLPSSNMHFEYSYLFRTGLPFRSNCLVLEFADFRQKCKAIGLPFSLKLDYSRNANFRPKYKAIGLPFSQKLAGS